MLNNSLFDHKTNNAKDEKLLLLKKARLFQNFTDDELLLLLENSDYYLKECKKGTELYPPDSAISHAGIILSGEVDVLHISVTGDEEIVGRNTDGDIVGPAFCITGMTNNLSHYRVIRNSKILFLNINSLLLNPVNKSYYTKFVTNITTILARNNIILNRKIQLLTQKSLRKKLLTYFIQLSKERDNKAFTLSFTREQLAQYVCSERSSVCRELGKMQDDGLIKVDGNLITLSSQGRASYLQ